MTAGRRTGVPHRRPETAITTGDTSVLGRLRRVLADLVGGYVLWVPGRIGSMLRIFYYRARGAEIGRGVRIDPGVSIDHPDLVTIGDGTWLDRFVILIAGTPRPGRETKIVGPERPDLIGRIRVGQRCHIAPHCVLSGIGGLEIGDDVGIATGCALYSLSHHYRSWKSPDSRSFVFSPQVTDEEQSMVQGTIVVGTNVGIAVHSLLLPGTVLGADSFVRPLSVVSGAWEVNSMIGGNPAKLSGQRFADRIG